jgi:alkanesulfonate monooxygenase SsuD/methylene tetrahydromethanopterin reductase-like flavin-dependent oxidoreductase (luciferase family)
MPTTLGAVFLPFLPPERLQSVARAADEAGLAELWLWEDCFRESGVASAAAALAWTSRLRVGVGLLPVPLRNVALTAMELSTLSRMFPGRIRAGVGHGVQEWMEQVGGRAASPLTLLREYATALRALLAGERVTVAGRYVRLQDVALDWPPTSPLPLLAGGVGPKSLALCGELADGTLLTAGTTPDGVRAARAIVDEARRAAGLTAPHTLTAHVFAATGSGAAERLAAELRLWEIDPREDVGAAGSAQDIAAAVRRWVDAGVDTVVLQPTRDEPDVEGFVRFAAQEVAPLL